MPGAPKQFDTNEVITKALEVFRAHGYEATSMQDLVDAMGVNRASMYATFGCKREIFRTTLEYYCEAATQFFKRQLSVSQSPLANLKNLCDSLDDRTSQAHRYGCLAHSTAVELGPHDEEFAAIVRKFWDGLERLLENTLDNAVAAGELSTATESAALARVINATLQGRGAMTKVCVPEARLKTIFAQLFKIITNQK